MLKRLKWWTETPVGMLSLQTIGGTLRRNTDTVICPERFLPHFVADTSTAGTRGEPLPLGHKVHREMLEHRQLLLEFICKNRWWAVPTWHTEDKIPVTHARKPHMKGKATHQLVVSLFVSGLCSSAALLGTCDSCICSSPCNSILLRSFLLLLHSSSPSPGVKWPCP